MAYWMPNKVLALDTESSSVRIDEDRIATACAAIVGPAGVEFQRDWVIAIDIPMDPAATEVNGLTDEYLKQHGRPADEAIPEIANAIRYAVHSKIPIVAYNGQFDISFVDRECRRWLGQGLVDFVGADIAPVIDPYVIDRAIDRYRKGKRKLGITCEFFGVSLEDAHTAAADALAAVGVARALAARCDMPAGELRAMYADRRYPDDLVRGFQRLGRMGVGELHTAQVGWYREQTESYAQYLRREAEQIRHRADTAEDDEQRAIAVQELAETEARIDGLRYEWPLVPYVAQAVLPV